MVIDSNLIWRDMTYFSNEMFVLTIKNMVIVVSLFLLPSSYSRINSIISVVTDLSTVYYLCDVNLNSKSVSIAAFKLKCRLDAFVVGVWFKSSLELRDWKNQMLNCCQLSKE